jgi:hypothetical protein
VCLSCSVFVCLASRNAHTELQMSGSEALENAAECGDTLSDTNASQFRYKSIYHAFRMFDEVVLECARVTEEVQVTLRVRRSV